MNNHQCRTCKDQDPAHFFAGKKSLCKKCKSCEDKIKRGTARDNDPDIIQYCDFAGIDICLIGNPKGMTFPITPVSSTSSVNPYKKVEYVSQDVFDSLHVELDDVKGCIKTQTDKLIDVERDVQTRNDVVDSRNDGFGRIIDDVEDELAKLSETMDNKYETFNKELKRVSERMKMRDNDEDKIAKIERDVLELYVKCEDQCDKHSDLVNETVGKLENLNTLYMKDRKYIDNLIDNSNKMNKIIQDLGRRLDKVEGKK